MSASPYALTDAFVLPPRDDDSDESMLEAVAQNLAPIRLLRISQADVEEALRMEAFEELKARYEFVKEECAMLRAEVAELRRAALPQTPVSEDLALAVTEKEEEASCSSCADGWVYDGDDKLVRCPDCSEVES